MKGSLWFASLVLALSAPAMAADNAAADGGPWADDASTVSAPANQGRQRSQERVDRAEAAGRAQSDQVQQNARDSLQRNLERQRQDSSREADSLRQRANPSGYQPHH